MLHFVLMLLLLTSLLAVPLFARLALLLLMLLLVLLVLSRAFNGGVLQCLLGVALDLGYWVCMPSSGRGGPPRPRSGRDAPPRLTALGCLTGSKDAAGIPGSPSSLLLLLQCSMLAPSVACPGSVPPPACSHCASSD